MDADEREMARFFGLSFSATSGSWRRNFWRGDKKIIGCVNCWSSLYLWICYGLEWTRTVILIQAEGKGIKMEKKFPAQFRLILESIVLAEKLQTSSRNWNKKTWQLGLSQRYIQTFVSSFLSSLMPTILKTVYKARDLPGCSSKTKEAVCMCPCGREDQRLQ